MAFLDSGGLGTFADVSTSWQISQSVVDGRAPSQDATTMVMSGLAGPLHSPPARDTAVIGFGSGTSTTTVLAFPSIRRVDTIENEPAMVEGADFFDPLATPAYANPRSTVIIDDAKSSLARSGNRLSSWPIWGH
jgi:spermidine synthase